MKTLKSLYAEAIELRDEHDSLEGWLKKLPDEMKMAALISLLDEHVSSGGFSKWHQAGCSQHSGMLIRCVSLVENICRSSGAGMVRFALLMVGEDTASGVSRNWDSATYFYTTRRSEFLAAVDRFFELHYQRKAESAGV